MKKEILNTEDLENKFVPELVKVFELTDLLALKADIQENGILMPISLSKDRFIIDGYRRVLCAKELGIKEIPVLITQLDATTDNRIALNNHRQFTWKDLRNLYLLLFKQFGNKQGKRLGEKFDRYEEISKRTNYRFKDKHTLSLVESILQNDIEGWPLSQWLFSYKSDVKSVHEFLMTWITGMDEHISRQVFNFEISPKEALILIERLKYAKDKYVNEFVIPDSKNIIASIHNGEPEELLVKIDKKSINLLFFEPDRYAFMIPNNESHYPAQIPQHPQVYGQKAANVLLPWIDRLDDSSSVYVFTKEYYKDGFAAQIPANLITSICNETGLEYKQTLFITNGDTFIEDTKSNNAFTDGVPQIIWFVKSKKEASKVFNHALFNTNIDDKNLNGIYKKCSNVLNNTQILDILINRGFVNRDKSNTNYAALIPILSSTKEGDLIVDISMKSEIGSIATIMNRRFIGVSNQKKSLEISAKALSAAVKQFDINSLNILNTQSSDYNHISETINA